MVGGSPHVYVIAGPNGAGKTTAAMTLLPDFLHIEQFVNADEIAGGISPLAPETAAIEAGKVMLKRLDTIIKSKQSFAFETTLSGNVHVRTLKKCREAGYVVNIIFLYLESAEVAVNRVEQRVLQGGHNVPKKDITRRYYAGIEALFSKYIELADYVEVYDNNGVTFIEVASKESCNPWNVVLPELWQKIQGRCNGS